MGIALFQRAEVPSGCSGTGLLRSSPRFRVLLKRNGKRRLSTRSSRPRPPTAVQSRKMIPQTVHRRATHTHTKRRTRTILQTLYILQALRLPLPLCASMMLVQEPIKRTSSNLCPHSLAGRADVSSSGALASPDIDHCAYSHRYVFSSTITARSVTIAWQSSAVRVRVFNDVL